jgi:hypothetical protein
MENTKRRRLWIKRGGEASLSVAVFIYSNPTPRVKCGVAKES